MLVLFAVDILPRSSHVLVALERLARATEFLLVFFVRPASLSPERNG